MMLKLILETILFFLWGVGFCDIIRRDIVGSPNKGLALFGGFISIALMIYTRPQNEKQYERACKENNAIQMLLGKPPIWLLVILIFNCFPDVIDFLAS